MGPDRLHGRGWLLVASITLVLVACPSSKRLPAESAPAGKGPRCSGSVGQEANLFGSPSDAVYEDNAVLAWPRSMPAAEGLDPSALEEIGGDMAVSHNARSLIVIRNGKLVYERYFNGGTRTTARIVYSIEKSFVGLLTGISIAKGEIPSIDAPIADLLPKSLAREPGAKEVTVRELLTMSSGIETEWGRLEVFDRIGKERHRVRAILREPHAFKPGSKFNYSTLGTYLLGAILAHVSGSSLCDLAQDRLLTPIGATIDHAHSDPDGYLSGSMFLTPLELARVGQLVLQMGSWAGKSIVPASWIRESMTQRRNLGCPRPDQTGYGYLWWLSQIAGLDTWHAEGSGGQSISVVPGAQLVVVATHANEYPEEKQVVPYRRLLRRILGSITSHPVDERIAACPLRDISKVRPNGTQPQTIVEDPALDVAFDWSPDGSRILFVSDRAFNAELYSMAADGSDVRRLTRNFSEEVFPSWSPDGKKIAFTSNRRGSEDLFVMDPDGSHVRSLVGSSDGDEQAPTWSPDGRRIAFTKGDHHSGLGVLWAIDVDGSHAHVLLNRQVRFPRWSPDGSAIAFGMMVGKEAHVGIFSLSSHRVTDLGPGDGPSWSPDGKRLAVFLFDSESRIDLVTIADRGRTHLPEAIAGVPLWSPDGRWIVVTT